MSNAKPDLQIQNDDKFFSRFLSKEAENALSNQSFRVYYGGAPSAVPFVWESQPGTPKNKLCDTSLPPLTPPPSYLFTPTRDSIKKPSKLKLIHTIFPRLVSVKKSHVSPSSSVSSSSSWSSSLSSPTPTRRRPSLSSFEGEDEDVVLGSPTSTLCFGTRVGGGGGAFRGCYSMVMMKKSGGHQGTA